MYNHLKNLIASVEQELEEYSFKLNQYPKNEIGLVLDSSKDKRYHELKQKYQYTFDRLRSLNTIKVK